MTTSNDHPNDTDHSVESDLLTRVAEVLTAAGKDSSNTTLEDLSSIDQRHAFGSDGTMRLAHHAGITANDHILDIGSGFGGPARMLAQVFGCRVTGIELGQESVDMANFFNELTGMSDRVSFQQGDGAELPFDGESFDVVWTQQVAQNVPDKEAFIGGMARVLKPGGRLVMDDVYRGSTDIPCQLPSVWGGIYDSREEFIASDAEMRDAITRHGLAIASWVDMTAAGSEWCASFERTLNVGEAGIPGLDSSLLGDPEQLKPKIRNAIIDLDAGAMGLFEVVARKP